MKESTAKAAVPAETETESEYSESVVNIKRKVECTFDEAVERITKALADRKFGVLTRIDMDAVLKAKIDKVIPRTTILGFCNPGLAHGAYLINTDVTSVLPCNCVLRELSEGVVSVEITKPKSVLEAVGEPKLTEFAGSAEDSLREALAAM